LRPSEQVVKIVFDELVTFWAGNLRAWFYEDDSNVVMIVGLQGSGKQFDPEDRPLAGAKPGSQAAAASTDVSGRQHANSLVIAKATGQSIFEKPETE